uniref:NADH-ubiquinone oxidoreductase chain 5 n=1 Tax=Mutela dubia TaxID=152234 RepID=A0A1Y9T6A5_9BIVA|nr:NADH dehydrogenase subunit 5 [Mutela dubia]AQT38517.1 NADH dehydrogenase subunit 5 [Mutela dubia]
MKGSLSGSWAPLCCGLFMYFIGGLVIFLGVSNSMISVSGVMVEWKFMDFLSVDWSLPVILDYMSVLFFSLVCVISGSVFLFSMSYMEGEVFLRRFSLIVMAFVASMGLLIFIPSLVTVLLGWDGLGIVSFALVIYYQNKKSLSAGMVTVLVNRIGDVMLILSVCLMVSWGDWMLMNNLSVEYIWGICLMIVIGGMTKSAQIPFSSWLPAAMAAPTPVSALVHSSTLVTAGVYLVIRFYPSLLECGDALWVLGKLGGLTMLMAGLGACYEVDLKKVIALSTLSQLGLMMFTVGLGYPVIAAFHLFTHAIFKALLFLCAGSLIHSVSDSQDGRIWGGLGKLSPFSSGCLVLSSLILSGMPFLSGFYSKDTILEGCLVSTVGCAQVCVGLFGACLSMLYSARLAMVGLYRAVGGSSGLGVFVESPYTSVPMVILSFGGIYGGWLMQGLWVDVIGFDLVGGFGKVIISFVTFIGMLYIVNYYIMMIGNLRVGVNKGVYFLSYMWFLSKLSGGLVSGFGISGALKVSEALDFGWMEIFGGQGAFNVVKGLIYKGHGVQKLSLLVFVRSFLFFFVVIMSVLYLI